MCAGLCFKKLFLFGRVFFVQNIVYHRNFPERCIIPKMADQRQNKLICYQKDHSQPSTVGSCGNSKINQFPQVDIEKMINLMEKNNFKENGAEIPIHLGVGMNATNKV